MAFCSKCGTNVSDGTAFCPQCGAAIGAAAAPPPYASAPPYAAYPAAPATSGLQENVAGLLCYVLGWLTGIIFLLIDKRPFVRFHAAQSIVVFGALFVIRIALAFTIGGTYYLGLGLMHLMLFFLFGLVTFILWLVLMVQAYQGKWFEIPIAAGIARNLAGKVN